MIKIVFFGTFQYSVPALEALIKTGYKITAVVTNPDSLQGRKKELSPTPIKLAAQVAGLKVLQPSSLKIGQSAIYPLEDWSSKVPTLGGGPAKRGAKELESLSRARSRGSRVGDMDDWPDLGIVVAYSKILPKEIIELPRFGTLNIHPSLLPYYRGPSPVQTAILNGEKETGVSIMKIDEEVDHGPILTQAKYPIPPNAYHPQITQELFQLGADLLIKTIPDWITGNISPLPQDHPQATFTKKFSWPDGRIDWKQPAEKIYNQIRALNPEPGTWTTYHGKILKILKAEVRDEKILLKEVQLEGKKPMPFEDFLRGAGPKEIHFE